MDIIKDKTLNILIAGEGGQGVQTIAKALLSAATEAKYKTTYIPSFGVEQRGTPSIAYLRVGHQIIRYPKFENADLIILMATRAINFIKTYINTKTDLIFDSSKIPVQKIPKNVIQLYGIPATKFARDNFDPRSINVLFFGILTKYLRINEEISWRSIFNELKIKFKTKEAKDINQLAFNFGYEAVLEKNIFSKPKFETKNNINVFKNSKKHAIINPSLCKGCGICILKCPVGALSYGEDLGVFSTAVPDVDLEKCIVCGNCRRFCPDGAVAVDRINTK